MGRQAASAFVLGVVTGLFLKEVAQHEQEFARRTWTHRDHERTVTFGENLPDSLERREPVPEPGQPRFGGTGAIGFSRAAATEPSGPDRT